MNKRKITLPVHPLDSGLLSDFSRTHDWEKAVFRDAQVEGARVLDDMWAKLHASKPAAPPELNDAVVFVPAPPMTRWQRFKAWWEKNCETYWNFKKT